MSQKQRIISAIVLIAIGIITRIALSPYNLPNVEIITATTIISGALLGGYFALIVPFSILLVSDIYIGNNYIFLFTWSGFAFVGILGYSLRDKVNFSAKSVGILTAGGISGVLLFFLWTNFGWWLITPYYPHTFDGLIACYVMGLPFLYSQLLTNLIVIPILSIPVLYFLKNDLNFEIKPIEKYATITAGIVLAVFSFIPFLIF